MGTSANILLLPLLSGSAMAAVRNRMPDLCVTTAGDPCVFPFTYRGVEYLECTFTDSPTPWCATRVDFSGNVITNRWGDCDTTGPSCSSSPSQPV